MSSATDAIYFYSTKHNLEPQTCYYSQFWRTDIYDPEWDHTFQTTEQIYQYEKVLLAIKQGCQLKSKGLTHTDVRLEDRPKEILATAAGTKQASLARDLDFSKLGKEWNDLQNRVLYKANWLKFTQNPDLRDWLLSTNDRELVEASPNDRVCGIGYAANEAAANRPNWGINKLGKTLMRVRQDIRAKLAEDANFFEANDHRSNVCRIKNSNFRHHSSKREQPNRGKKKKGHQEQPPPPVYYNDGLARTIEIVKPLHDDAEFARIAALASQNGRPRLQKPRLVVKLRIKSLGQDSLKVTNCKQAAWPHIILKRPFYEELGTGPGCDVGGDREERLAKYRKMAGLDDVCRY